MPGVATLTGRDQVCFCVWCVFLMLVSWVLFECELTEAKADLEGGSMRRNPPPSVRAWRSGWLTAGKGRNWDLARLLHRATCMNGR